MWEALSTLHHSFGDPEPRRVSGEDGWMSCEATSHLERSPKLAPQKSQEPKIFTKKNSDCREEREKLTEPDLTVTKTKEPHQESFWPFFSNL